MASLARIDPIPLEEDASGALRVGGTRVLLELVVRAFDDGATPEGIVDQYPSLRLADVYDVVAYCLRHREEINAYLDRREGDAASVRRRIDAIQPDLSELRQRILARRPAGGPENAPADR